MKYAIIEVSGHQFWVEIGKYYNFNRLPLKVGEQLKFNKILLCNNNSTVLIGNPYLERVEVKGRILAHFRSLKCIVYKMRPKKKNKKKTRTSSESNSYSCY